MFFLFLHQSPNHEVAVSLLLELSSQFIHLVPAGGDLSKPGSFRLGLVVPPAISRASCHGWNRSMYNIRSKTQQTDTRQSKV